MKANKKYSHEKVELEEDANKLLSELTAIEKADEHVSKLVQMGLWTDEKTQEELDRLYTQKFRMFAELILGRKTFKGGKEKDE
nr:MAG TPA: hypothetical protein [Caudoviricetes sp.]